MAVRETLQANGELHVTTSDNVLNLELGELGVEAQLLDNTCVLTRRQPRVVLALRTRDDHLARGENKGGCLGITNTHDDSCKTLSCKAHWHATTRSQNSSTNLGVILCIPSV